MPSLTTIFSNPTRCDHCCRRLPSMTMMKRRHGVFLAFCAFFVWSKLNVAIAVLKPEQPNVRKREKERRKRRGETETKQCQGYRSTQAVSVKSSLRSAHIVFALERSAPTKMGATARKMHSECVAIRLTLFFPGRAPQEQLTPAGARRAAVRCSSPN